jgi:hypothetical protein
MGSSPRAPRDFRLLPGIVPLLAASAMLLTSSPAVPSDDTMRCGTRLVGQGDGKDKVRTLCGEPTSITQAGYVGGPGYYPNYNSGVYRYSYPLPNWTAVPVEVWTYNLGPNKLLRTLRFVGDELDEIRTNGYGY